MKSRQAKHEVRYVLKEISTYPSKQIPKQTEVRAFLQNKVDRLQIENRVLAEQLSQQIRNRETLGQLLAEEKQKYQQALQTINKMGMAETNPTQQLTKMPSHQRLKYLKQSNSSRRQSVNLDNEVEHKRLREKLENLQIEVSLLRDKSQKDEEVIKKLKQELLFSKEHLKRAEQEKNELQQEMEQGRNQIFQANQLMARQNAQILKMKFQLQRIKKAESGNRIDVSSLYPDLWDLEDLQHQLSQLLLLNIKDNELRSQIQKQTREAIKEWECGWLNNLNKQSD